MIPAGQWPFQRWLLDSAVAPTPVSAVMHAGIVNAGGIILTLFAPLFNQGNVAQITLLILASISILMGTGIMFVQVDYKRQLVGSTIAQMGFMLVQCALGAYLAAIIHAVLHGLFKSTLFLRAGSAIHRDQTYQKVQQTYFIIRDMLWSCFRDLGGDWLLVNLSRSGLSIISAIILGWSVAYAWIQLIVSGYGRIGKIAGISLFLAGAILYGMIHSGFSSLLDETIETGIQPPVSALLLFLFIVLIGSAIGLILARNQTSRAFTILYLWLVQLGEPHHDVVESHPKYLSQSMSQGGNE